MPPGNLPMLVDFATLNNIAYEPTRPRVARGGNSSSSATPRQDPSSDGTYPSRSRGLRSNRPGRSSSKGQKSSPSSGAKPKDGGGSGSSPFEPRIVNTPEGPGVILDSPGREEDPDSATPIGTSRLSKPSGDSGSSSGPGQERGGRSGAGSEGSSSEGGGEETITTDNGITQDDATGEKADEKIKRHIALKKALREGKVRWSDLPADKAKELLRDEAELRKEMQKRAKVRNERTRSRRSSEDRQRSADDLMYDQMHKALGEDRAEKYNLAERWKATEGNPKARKALARKVLQAAAARNRPQPPAEPEMSYSEKYEEAKRRASEYRRGRNVDRFGEKNVRDKEMLDILSGRLDNIATDREGEYDYLFDESGDQIASPI